MALRAPTLGLAILAVASAAAAEPTVSRRVVNDGNVILENVPEVPAELAARLHRYQSSRDARFQDWAADGPPGLSP